MSSMDSEADMFARDSMSTNAADSAPMEDSDGPRDDSVDMRSPPEGTGSDDEHGDNDSDDGVSPAEIVKMMNEIWLNESAAPTLLPHRHEVVQALLGIIDDMEHNFMENRDNPDLQLTIHIHKMEVHRLTYVINNYLRKRLEKIDQHPEQIKLENDERIRIHSDRELLSETETDYINKRLAADRAMMNRAFFNHLPDVLRTLEAPGQDLSIERVYLQVKSEPVNGISIPDMKEPHSEYLIDLQPRSRHLLPFLSIREALEENLVRLM